MAKTIARSAKGTKITQNQAIFIGLGILVAFIAWQYATGTTDKDIGLGGDDRR